ncbi:MAG: Crp/Fnr family transcriptional regulator [Xanthomonadales bacterium]|nr:Crp/Fnr family transcriptional regulator [Xanthomonadales bacterium]
MDASVLESIHLFRSLPPEDLQALSRHLLLRRIPRNSIVINEGDETKSLYVILKGRVKVFLNDRSGKEVILNVVGKGDYFGEVSLFDEGPRSASIMTLEDSEFAVLERASLLACMKSSPELSLTIIRGLTERLRGLSGSVRNLALMDVYGRVAHTLIELAEDSENGNCIPGGITYKELAQRVGASSKMVGRVMKDLKAGGYVSKLGRDLVINRDFPSAW